MSIQRPLTLRRLLVGGVTAAALTVGAASVPATATATAAPSAPAGHAAHQADRAGHHVEKGGTAKHKRQLVRIKKRARAVATTRIAAYRTLRTDQRLTALPPALADSIRTYARSNEDRLRTLRTRVTVVRSVAAAKRVRARILMVRPTDLATMVSVAYRATTTDDAGVLEGLLEELVGSEIDGTLLAPLVTLVDGLLDALTGGAESTDVVGDLLAGLGELLDGLLGGLLGGSSRA